MLIKVLITPMVKRYWEQYGNLSAVTNKLLSEVDFEDRPILYPADYGEKPIKIMLDITNSDFLGIREIYKPSDPRISLSRVLTYYAANDYANQAGWTIDNVTLKNNINLKLHKKYALVLLELNRLYNLSDACEQEEIQQIIVTLNNLKQKLFPNGRILYEK